MLPLKNNGLLVARGCLHPPEQSQQAGQQLLRRGRAPGYFDIDGDDIFHRAATGIGDAEFPAVAGAVAGRDDEPGFGAGVIGAFQRGLHMPRYWTRYQQAIRVSGRGDEMHAEALNIVIGIVEGVYFQFAAVTGPRVHVAYRQAAGETPTQHPLYLDAQCFDVGICGYRDVLGDNADADYLGKQA